jgi:hypothetical protein
MQTLGLAFACFSTAVFSLGTVRAQSASGGQPHHAQVYEKMVRPERFELPTFWFVARRSIQLS